MKKIDILVKKNDRVLKVLERECPNVLYSAFDSALRKKDVLVDGVRIKDNINVYQGNHITVYVNDTAIKSQFSVVYEDENILVVNKNKGIEVCDGDNNLVMALKSQNKIVYPVHRIDRNTLGLVVFAKNKEAEKELLSAFKNHTVDKFYLAEVVGIPNKMSETLKGFLVKDKETSSVKIFKNKVPNSEEITTSFLVLKSSGNTSLLEVKIKEGKTHQIRAHLAYRGYPVIGDGKYGKNEDNKKYKEKTQRLRSNRIVFNFDKNCKLYYLNNLTFDLGNNF